MLSCLNGMFGWEPWPASKAVRLVKVAAPSCDLLASCPTYISQPGTYSGWTSIATVVDQLADGVRVVVEVRGEVGIGAGVGVVGDELVEVIGDGLSIVVAHAGTSTAIPPGWALSRAPTTVSSVWRGESGNREGGSSQDGGECVHLRN